MRVWLGIAVAVAALAIAAGVTGIPAGAHHASAPFYDNTKSVEIDGEVTRFLFRNPHTFLFVESQGENGETIAWEIEMGTALSMSRRGWSPETIEVGDRIKAVGQPSRAPGTYGMCCAELTRADGSPIRPAG